VHSAVLFPLIRATVVCLGVLLLLASTFNNRSWTFAFWVKIAFWMVTAVGLAWAGIRFVLLLHGQSLSRETYHVLYSLQPFLLGFALGVLSLFFLSGEAVAGYRAWRDLKSTKRPNHSLEPIAGRRDAHI
jgi:hypothetical protein